MTTVSGRGWLATLLLLAIFPGLLRATPVPRTVFVEKFGYAR
ncbi:MAG: hypothetical protein R3E12_18045 [Candidatus Eisenbacteria bacterium]